MVIYGDAYKFEVIHGINHEGAADPLPSVDSKPNQQDS